MTQSDLYLIAANLAVCCVGVLMCICRAGMMTASRTKLAIRAQYAIWTGFFFASGLSWTYDEPATITHLLMSSSVLLHLILGFDAWRDGAPSYTYRAKEERA